MNLLEGDELTRVLVSSLENLCMSAMRLVSWLWGRQPTVAYVPSPSFPNCSYVLPFLRLASSPCFSIVWGGGGGMNESVW